jgi:hypothetical protein
MGCLSQARGILTPTNKKLKSSSSDFMSSICQSHLGPPQTLMPLDSSLPGVVAQKSLKEKLLGLHTDEEMGEQRVPGGGGTGAKLQ